MEDLDKLPPLVLVAFGLGLALIFCVRYFGLMSGERSSPAGNPAAALVASVIVDPAAINRLTDQAARLNDNLEELNETAKEKLRVDGLMATELDRIREELRIQRELARRRNG